MRQRGLPPPHRATTVELRTLYPFVVPDDLGVDGCYIGREASGGLFCFDPWECYAKGKLTSPNIVVFGQIGRGKSAFVKVVRVAPADASAASAGCSTPRASTERLARACGVTPLRLGPGLGAAPQPLDVAARADGDQRDREPALAPAHQRRAELLAAPARQLPRAALLPEERAAADVALRAAGGPRPCPPWRRWPRPCSSPRARPCPPALGTDTEGLRQDGRQVALELRRLVHGDLAGMFDGETSPGWASAWARHGGPGPVPPVRLSGPGPAHGVRIVVAPGCPGRGRGTKRLVVLDEAWAVLATWPRPAGCRPRSSCRRSYGVANIAVVHRLSDLNAAGLEGSEQQRLAEGLLADAETRVVFGQAPGEAERAGDLLGLTRTEQLLLSQLPRGVALWRVGQSSFLVEHHLGPRSWPWRTPTPLCGLTPVGFPGFWTENSGT